MLVFACVFARVLCGFHLIFVDGHNILRSKVFCGQKGKTFLCDTVLALTGDDQRYNVWKVHLAIGFCNVP